jgi:hypothetical protein
MGLSRGWVKRLEHSSRGDLRSFLLEDGTRYYYDPSSPEIFLHGMDFGSAQFNGDPLPEPPETIKAITRARNRAAALDAVVTGDPDNFPYERDALIADGELVPRSLVAGYELGEKIEGSKDLAE